MACNLHKIKRGMTPFKIWRGIKKAHGENKVNLIFILFQTAVCFTVPTEWHNIWAGMLFTVFIYSFLRPFQWVTNLFLKWGSSCWAYFVGNVISNTFPTNAWICCLVVKVQTRLHWFQNFKVFSFLDVTYNCFIFISKTTFPCEMTCYKLNIDILKQLLYTA